MIQPLGRVTYIRATPCRHTASATAVIRSPWWPSPPHPSPACPAPPAGSEPPTDRVVSRNNHAYGRVSIPRQSRGHYEVSRSKRLFGDAGAAPTSEPPDGGPGTRGSADPAAHPHHPSRLAPRGAVGDSGRLRRCGTR